MQQTTRPVSKLKVVLLWTILIGNLVFWSAFWLLRNRNEPAPVEQEPGAQVFLSMFLLVTAALFIAASVGSYFLVYATHCLTFNFNRPFLPAYKGKLYLAKIIVPTLAAIGAGFVLQVFLSPLLKSFGVDGQMTFMLPLFLAIIPMQIVLMWINIWMPVTKKLITRRLAARGIGPAQVQS